MSGKYAEKVTCVKVERRFKEAIFILLCEWSDITASYIGRTNVAIYNLKEYINNNLNPEETLDLRLKETSFLDIFLPNKNIRILNNFFATLTKQSNLTKNSEVSRFFTYGSSPTLKEFLNTFKLKPAVFFSFESVTATFPAFDEYEEITEFSQSGQENYAIPKTSSDIPQDSPATPVYSKVQKPAPATSLEPDIITSSKSTAQQEVSDESEKNEMSNTKVISTPPRPLFPPPSLPGNTNAMGTNRILRPLEQNVVSLNDYESSADGVLSFDKGTIASLISQSDHGWWCVKIGSQIGWVPGEYWEISEVVPVTRNYSGWFVGSISREECESMMIKYANEGDFVVRQSLNCDLALSVKHNGEIRHFPIKVTADGKFNIGQYDFKSVNHIISYYRKNALFYDDDNEAVKLGQPVVIVKENEDGLEI